ncbi:flagellar M-ring protein FliF [Desulfocucumis palustris]|uniref:Flagellar M-ring protein n=1 Tax=Desulfocucumis palustris TaxID=1898651 RepID=A0A2L2XAI7_9FIRM|nr:flagellar basal-body MS-ring/collar protein FliF [Desulfocucumis palustris]GBF33188.1 flagellar M-ring protein FliF [Desulfocucumis palustris]
MNFGELMVRFRERWQGLTRVQKIIAVSVVVVILLALAFLGQKLFSTPYAPLFTGLDPKEAGKIAEELKKEKIPYRVTDQGKTIEVPENKVYETRISLASSGALYNSGVGFELFDQNKLGVTEFEQQVGYQRALQEELRRTIVQLDAVEQARVHLVLPRKSLFLDEQVEPSASIALKLKPSATLAPEHVRGIVDLVTGSVEGLKPENVNIIDMEGNSLTDTLRLKDNSLNFTLQTLDHYEIKRAYEKELENRIQQMLRQILGPGKAVSMVTAELDFDQKQSTSTTYDEGKTLSQHNLEETGSGSTEGGPPGTDSELPGSTVSAQASTGSGSSYSKQENTTNYQVPSKQESVVEAPGSVKRLSASVVVNGNFPQSQLQQINNVVATAIGYDQARGDQITVSSMAFDDSLQKEAEAEMAAEKARAEAAKRNMLIAAMASGAFILLVLLVAYIAMLRRRRAARLAEELARQQEEEEINVLREDEPLEVVQRARSREDDIKDIAQENPDEVAEIIKLWLRE